MIIIGEGPECAGKTTLLKQISEQTGYQIVHMKKPETQQDKDEMFNAYVAMICNRDNIIFDRCWYSEMVYGKIMRDKSYISMEQMRYLEDILAKHKGGMIIHCTDTTQLLWNRCAIRGEDYVTDVDTLNELKCGFEHLMHSVPHSIPVVRYELSNQKMS
jgi:thymidylate kinase